MVMARVLTKEDLAAYRQTLLAYAVVGPFLQLGIQQGLFYFLPVEKKRSRGRVADALFVVIITGNLFGLFIALGGNQLLASQFSNPQVAAMLLWMIPYALFTLPSSLAPTVLVAHDHAIKSSLFVITRQFLIGVGTIIPVIIWQNAESALIGNVVACMLVGIEAIFLMFRMTPASASRPSLRGIRELLTFSVPLGLATMAGTITMQIDKLIVGFMCSPEEFAVFALGAIEVPLLAALTGAVSMAVVSDMRKAVVEGDLNEARRLFGAVAKKTSLLIFPIAIILMAVAEPFIETIYGPAYSGSSDPFRVYLLKLPFRIVVYGAILLALGKNNVILFVTVGCLILSALLSVLFVELIGPTGAALGPVLTLIFVNIPIFMFYIARGLKVDVLEVLPFGSLVKNFISALPTGLLAYLTLIVCRNYTSLLQIAAVAIVCGSYCFIWWNGRLFKRRSLKTLMSRS